MKEVFSMSENMNKTENKSGITSFCFDFVSIITAAIVAVALVFIFLFRTVGVVGSSMYPTLHNADRIILNNRNYVNRIFLSKVKLN